MSKGKSENPEQKIYERPLSVRMSRGQKLELARLCEKYETNQSQLIKSGLKLLVARLKWCDAIMRAFTESPPQQIVNMLISKSVEIYDQEEKKLTLALEKFLGESLGEGSRNGLSRNNQRKTDQDD